MVLKPGYKQTEVGVIPVDWEVMPLGLRASFRTGPFGSALHKSDYTSDGVPVINPMHIIDGQLIPTVTMSITENAARNLKDFRLKPNEIVIGRRGEMGRCAVVQANQDGWLCGTGSMIVRCGKDTAPAFLQRVLSSSCVIAAIEDTSVGSTMINLNQSTLSGLKLQFPTLAEQTAIAEALSDADTLIESLEQLITKKRLIKQGAMRELLSPKDGWNEMRLGNAATLKARIGWQGLTTAEYLDSGDYHLVTGTDFKGGYINWDHCPYVDESRYKQDKNIQLRQHDVLVTKDGTIGKVALVKHLDKPATLNSGVFVIRPIENSFHPDFFYYLLCSNVFSSFLAQLSAGSTINHLYQKDFVTFNFKIPDTLDEQIAIATTLSDMDTEIAALDIKLTKSRALKQGMMHKLLTGRIRLVPPSQNHDDCQSITGVVL